MNIMDMIHALWDKDEHDNNLTMINFSLDYLDERTGEVAHKVRELTTNEPLSSFADIGGYTTIRFTYKYGSSTNFSKMRSIADDYSKLMTEFAYANTETEGVPCLRITIRPMSLRGAMITAVNPIFFNLQPHDPMYSECNEMQLLFEPDAVGFYYDENFDEEAAADKAKAEIVSERMNAENAEKKKMEQEAYKKERELEAERLMNERYDVHGERVLKEAYHGFGQDREKK